MIGIWVVNKANKNAKHFNSLPSKKPYSSADINHNWKEFNIGSVTTSNWLTKKELIHYKSSTSIMDREKEYLDVIKEIELSISEMEDIRRNMDELNAELARYSKDHIIAWPDNTIKSVEKQVQNYFIKSTRKSLPLKMDSIPGTGNVQEVKKIIDLPPAVFRQLYVLVKRAKSQGSHCKRKFAIGKDVFFTNL